VLPGDPLAAAEFLVEHGHVSVADLVVKLATTSSLEIRRSLGIHNAS
jgi:hypothetical protein